MRPRRVDDTRLRAGKTGLGVVCLMPWIVLAVVLWVVALLAVPQEDFRRLVPFGLIAGFGLALLINLFGGPILGLWGFRQLAWPILGIPFWVLLAWVPSVILFVHFLPGNALARLAWILVFPAIYTGLDYYFLQTGLRFYSPNWSLPYAFLLGVGSHLLILSFYLVSVRSPEAALTEPLVSSEAGRGQRGESVPSGTESPPRKH